MMELNDLDPKSLFKEPSGVELTRKGEAYAEKVLAEAGGVFFITLSMDDRAGIAYTIERLINILDAMEPDPDLEPYLAGLHQGSHTDDREGDDGYGGDCDREPSLGWTTTGHMGMDPASMFGPDLEADDADDEPTLGAPERHPSSWEGPWERSGELRREYGPSQERWASGMSTMASDDCEAVSEDEGAQDDREPSLGWQDEGAQGHLNGGDQDFEADLGTTEEIDQVRRLECDGGHFADLNEPNLGWAESFGKGIVGPQNCLDDREHEDEREQEYDGGEEETLGESPATIFGGGSVCQYEDGWRPAPGSGVAPAMVEKAKRLRNGVVVREFTQPSSIMTERLMPDDAIPEIDLASLRDHYRAAHGLPQ